MIAVQPDKHRSRLEDFYQSSEAYFDMLQRWEDPDHFRFLTQYLEKYGNRGERLLDVGCGTGYSTSLCREAGFNAFGTDLSQHLIERSRRFRGDGGPRYLLGSGFALPFRPDSFDLALIYDVIEHIPDVPAFLDEVIRVVKPGGKLICIAPNFITPLPAIKALLKRGGRHSIYRSRKEAFGGLLRNLRLLARKGLTKNARFEYRNPRTHDVWEREDDDTVYCASPIDFRRYLQRRNFRLIQYQNDGETAMHRAVARLWPSIASSIFIVAEKMP